MVIMFKNKYLFILALLVTTTSYSENYIVTQENKKETKEVLKHEKEDSGRIGEFAVSGNAIIFKGNGFLINNGVKMLFLTMGANGVKYCSKENSGYLQNPSVEVVDVTGAGDIFTSALVYAYSKGYDIKEMTKIAQCASIIKIGQNGTVPNNFSEKILLDEYIKRYRNV